MIISDKHRFVFVHIPKCAGTAVRNVLDKFDEWNFADSQRRVDYPSLGYLDLTHIPLFTLKNYFKNELKKIYDYRSFAVVRDPYVRFPSSLSQRFNMYLDQPIHKQSARAIKGEVEQTIRFLLRQPRDEHLLPAEYIHFQKQTDYVDIDGRQVLDSVYSVECVDELLDEVGRVIGQELEQVPNIASKYSNRTIMHRNEGLGRLIESTRPISRKLSMFLPETVKQRIRSAVYVPRNQRLVELFESNYVREFIRDYYADDLSLIERVNVASERPGTTTTAGTMSVE